MRRGLFRDNTETGWKREAKLHELVNQHENPLGQQPLMSIMINSWTLAKRSQSCHRLGLVGTDQTNPKWTVNVHLARLESYREDQELTKPMQSQQESIFPRHWVQNTNANADANTNANANTNATATANASTNARAFPLPPWGWEGAANTCSPMTTTCWTGKTNECGRSRRTSSTPESSCRWHVSLEDGCEVFCLGCEKATSKLGCLD